MKNREPAEGVSSMAWSPLGGLFVNAKCKFPRRSPTKMAHVNAALRNDLTSKNTCQHTQRYHTVDALLNPGFIYFDFPYVGVDLIIA